MILPLRLRCPRSAAALMRALPLLLTAALVPSSARAQRVALRGNGDVEIDRRLRDLLEAGNYQVVSADSVIQDTVRGSLLVLDATVAISTVVEGDVFAVASNLFLRPRARVRGDVVNAGGGLYRSQLAEIGGAVLSRPLAPYRVDRTPDRFVITAISTAPPALFLPGIKGFDAPTYDRVNGVNLGWGFGLRIPAGPVVHPELLARGRYFSERGELGGLAQLSLRVDTFTLRLGGQKGPVTNEDWIRGAISNSVSYFTHQKDYRDYYGATTVFAELERPVLIGAVYTTLRLRAQREDATSLVAGQPWGILKADSIIPNPSIDDGVISSLILDAGAEWIDSSSEIGAGATLEWAGRVADGEFAFGRYLASADIAFNTFRGHTLRLQLHAQGPLPGTESLPLQRWSFIGGSGTLYTFERAQFRGDRVLFLETMYRIPLPRRLALPVIGAPDLELLHNTGMAWTADATRDFEQNIGASLQFFSLYLRYMVDPADPSEGHDFSVGLHWPFGRTYPWEAPRTSPVRGPF